MRIGIFPNLVKRESAAIVQQMIKICEKHGIEYYLPAYVSESRQPAYQRIGAEHLCPRSGGPMLLHKHVHGIGFLEGVAAIPPALPCLRNKKS